MSMKNKTTKAAKATQTINGQTFTVTRLKTRHARKGETLSRGQAGGRPAADGNRPVGAYIACNGGWAANGQVGQGAQMVADLDAVKARYARVKGAENREAAREEAALRRAAKEAEAFAALDSLLASL